MGGLMKLAATLSVVLFVSTSAAAVAQESPRLDAQTCALIEAACRGSGPVPLTQAQPQPLPWQRYQPQKCSAAREAAEALYSEAHELARCASRGDFSNDCSRAARAVRDAASDYQAAIDSLPEICK